MVDSAKVLGSITYQGLPCAWGQFVLSPGFSPDRGFVVIFVKNAKAMKLQTNRPMFPLKDIGDAAFAMEGSVIVGSSLTLQDRGTLKISSQAGQLEYKNCYVVEEGVQEESQFFAKDGETLISQVKINFCDERLWWTRRGYVFGTFNLLGVDGKHIEATGKGEKGEPFTLEDLLQIGTEALCTGNELGEVKSNLQLADYRPTNLDPRFKSPGDFLLEITSEIGLLPCKQIDGKLDFYTPGTGQEPGQVFIPKDKTIHDMVVMGHDYRSDTILMYAQYPTSEEIEITFDPSGANVGDPGDIDLGTDEDPRASLMMLPDPRDGEFKPWQYVLPFYGMTEMDFKKVPCVHAEDQVAYCQKFVKKYLKGGLSNGDSIPNPFHHGGDQPRKDEELRRANLIGQNAFRIFRVPDADLAKLPFLEALISTDGKTETLSTGNPLPPICKVHTFTFDRVKDATNPLATSKKLWRNPKEPIELYAGDGFHIQSRTGIISFEQRVGLLFRMVDGRKERLPEEAPGAERPGTPFDFPRESFFCDPPDFISLFVAHTLRGTRDLRSGPGQRTKFPSKVAAIQLQERASPEDHFMAAFDFQGKAIPDLDAADKTFPEVHQMQGARKLTAIRNQSSTEIRDEKLNEQANRIVQPLLVTSPAVKGRRVMGYGIYTPKIDGIVSQVMWAVDKDGIATTEILLGCLRSSLSRSNLSTSEKEHLLQISAPAQGSRSPTNVMPE